MKKDYITPQIDYSLFVLKEELLGLSNPDDGIHDGGDGDDDDDPTSKERYDRDVFGSYLW